jgi:iron complex transport system permease protein
VAVAAAARALTDPFLLGVSSGASVEATRVLLFGVFFGLGLWAPSTGAILGALLAVVLMLLLRTRAYRPGSPHGYGNHSY